MGENMTETGSEIPDTDPFALFDAWFAEAEKGEPNDPNAMALATATPDGAPSVRMVLLKGHGDDTGFTFYTNAHSRKGEEIRENMQAALLFHWKSLRPAGPDRRAVARSQRGTGRHLFPFPRPRLAARLRRIGPVAPAGQPRAI